MNCFALHYRICRVVCWGQAGGGEWDKLGKHHHEQCCEGFNREQPPANGGQACREGARNPLLQREDYMVRENIHLTFKYMIIWTVLHSHGQTVFVI